METRQVRALVPIDVADALYAKANAEGCTLAELAGAVLAAHVATKMRKPSRNKAAR
ncbi:hypothetical protein [Tenggerimyces flavus]|uniref:CopG-like ribbon-helix-helix domain-containing protein n=1 Tax=Tenggerimyces flavus TaxID=1708749 RepID=A0ABV7YPB0_9ACTN|nr:hypothetical protein [Tenggerimyces flavus]MBM7787784.1 hypothetical protein [Tenggerimyces flavus]